MERDDPLTRHRTILGTEGHRLVVAHLHAEHVIGTLASELFYTALPPQVIGIEQVAEGGVVHSTHDFDRVGRHVDERDILADGVDRLNRQAQVAGPYLWYHGNGLLDDVTRRLIPGQLAPWRDLGRHAIHSELGGDVEVVECLLLSRSEVSRVGQVVEVHPLEVGDGQPAGAQFSHGALAAGVFELWKAHSDAPHAGACPGLDAPEQIPIPSHRGAGRDTSPRRSHTRTLPPLRHRHQDLPASYAWTNRSPCAASEPAFPPPLPRNTKAMPTARTAPAIGPAM